MKLEGNGKLLRIFVGESDKVHHHSLSDAIVRAARERGIAGCSVLRGIEGFGANSRVIHTAKILRLSEDLPIIIEIVDTDTNIRAFLPDAERLIEDSKSGALITIEDIAIIRYSSGHTTTSPS